MAKLARLQSGKGIDTITIEEAPVPAPGPGEALVRLRAATLNFRDIIMANGLIPGIAKAPDLIPLSCAAGEVISTGSGVTRVKARDRVSPIFDLDWITGPNKAMGGPMLGGNTDGVARQYAVFPAESLVHNPDDLGDMEAATMTCAALTSWSAINTFRPTRSGEWVLTHGTGGCSIAALQFAKAMGCNVAITSSSDRKLARAKSLGADVLVNYKTTPDWAGAVRNALGGNKVANVIDTIGAVQFNDNASLMIDGGQLSAIGMLGSDFSWSVPNPTVTLAPIGVGNRDGHEAMLRFIVQHKIKPVTDVVYDLDRLQDAYRCMESHQFFGKVGINLL